MRPYSYADTAPSHAHAYLWPALRGQLDNRSWPDKRAFDLGCGNGATANMLSELGFQVWGVDTSEQGIFQAQAAFPHLHLEVGNGYDDLATRFGPFPLVICLEVIEHCLDPRSLASTFLSLIAPGGLGFLTTPYHGYVKNVALAVSGKMDAHFCALWDGGHVKFFSPRTLTELLTEAGATNVQILRVGRIPALAKSMIGLVAK